MCKTTLQGCSECSLFFICREAGASLVAQRLKRLPVMQETRAWSLGWEDPPEKEMETHSSILAWRIPWMEEPGWLQPRHRKESDMTEWLHLQFLNFIITITIKNDPKCFYRGPYQGPPNHTLKQNLSVNKSNPLTMITAEFLLPHH